MQASKMNNNISNKKKSCNLDITMKHKQHHRFSISFGVGIDNSYFCEREAKGSYDIYHFVYHGSKNMWWSPFAMMVCIPWHWESTLDAVEGRGGGRRHRGGNGRRRWEKGPDWTPWRREMESVWWKPGPHKSSEHGQWQYNSDTSKNRSSRQALLLPSVTSASKTKNALGRSFFPAAHLPGIGKHYNCIKRLSLPQRCSRLRMSASQPFRQGISTLPALPASSTPTSMSLFHRSAAPTNQDFAEHVVGVQAVRWGFSGHVVIHRLEFTFIDTRPNACRANNHYLPYVITILPLW